MNCPGHDELMLWMDGEAGPDRAREIAGHVASCAACTAFTEGQERVERAYRDSYSPPPQEGFDILERRLRSRFRTGRSIPVLIPVAAALLVALAGLRLFGGREAVLLPGLYRESSPGLEQERAQTRQDTTTITVVAQAPAGEAQETVGQQLPETGSDLLSAPFDQSVQSEAVSEEGATGRLSADLPGGTAGMGGMGGGGAVSGGYGLPDLEPSGGPGTAGAASEMFLPPCENLQQAVELSCIADLEEELDLCRTATGSCTTADAACTFAGVCSDDGILILFDSAGEPSSPDSAFLDESLPGWKDSLRGMLLDSAASFPPGGLAELMGATGD
jgi:hypothetical protein